MNLHEIANQPGFGTGKRVRDMAAAEADCRAALPDPKKVAPVMAATDGVQNWQIASMGYDEETDADWFVVTDHVRASETLHLELPGTAKSDAENIAAIINAYRLGILVPK